MLLPETTIVMKKTKGLRFRYENHSEKLVVTI